MCSISCGIGIVLVIVSAMSGTAIGFILCSLLSMAKDEAAVSVLRDDVETDG